MTTGWRYTRFAAALAVGLALGTSAYADMQAARKALSNNNYDAAVQQLDQILDDQPNDAEARFLKGLALARSGDTDAALKVFQKLTGDQPKMAEAWNNLGVLEARKGDLKAARDALMKAVKLNPSHGPAQENLGDIYVALARNAYTRAGRLESDNAIARSKSQQLASFINSAGGLGAASQSQSDKKRSASQPASVAKAAPGTSGNSRSRGSSASAHKGKVMVDTSTPQAAVQSWARAWSDQDVGAYLSMYANKFKPADHKSRAAWAADRRTHVRRPDYIHISLNNAHVQRQGGQALVKFDQRYESNSYRDKERKALLLEKTSTGWKILREGKAGDVDFTAAAKNNAGGRAMAANDTGSGAAAGSIAGQSMGGGDASVRQAVRAALHDWAEAWSDEDVQTYLDAYSNNFQPQDGKSLSTWVRERREHVSRPAWIKIQLSDIDVQPQGNDRAQVSFEQRYRSNTYRDTERKHMTLVRENGHWRILKES